MAKQYRRPIAVRYQKGEPAPQPYALDDARPRSAAALAALATAAAPLACYAAAPAWVEPVSNVLDPCFFIIQFIIMTPGLGLTNYYANIEWLL